MANLTSGAGEKLRINMFRWSPDEERDRLLTAFQQNGGNPLLSILQAIPAAGYIWTDESLGYAVRYAVRQPLASGGERVILVTDRLLGSWSANPWTAKGEGGSENYPFTLIEFAPERHRTSEVKCRSPAKSH